MHSKAISADIAIYDFVSTFRGLCNGQCPLLATTYMLGVIVLALPMKWIRCNK